MAQNPLESVEVFLSLKKQFQLGDLPTEQSHPFTRRLSEWSQNSLEEALKAFHRVDERALKSFCEKEKLLIPVHKKVQKTLNEGGRIFLCGCGATGRLSLSLESLWRQSHFGDKAEKVIGFMAGGDVALVHALEGFEDFPAYGAEHLESLGFCSKDFLICCTEGGETPYVIGAAMAGARISPGQVAFFFCNPQEILHSKLERCREVFENPNIISLDLSVGPMALSGSTRLQASTVLMLAAGLCLFAPNEDEIYKLSQIFLEGVGSLNLSDLKSFIKSEAEVYSRHQKTIYEAGDLAMTVFTDTTERAPTFTLAAFDNKESQAAEPSWSYVQVPGAATAQEAWKSILGRAPRSLNWLERNPKTSDFYLNSFDFSQNAFYQRQKRWPHLEFYKFKIDLEEHGIRWNFREEHLLIPRLNQGLLLDHLLLKIYLNTHSTLLMGRLNRYSGNWMTYVYPTNGKLVDRSVRYVLGLLEREGKSQVSYEEVVRALFKRFPLEPHKKSIVLELFEEFKTRD